MNEAPNRTGRSEPGRGRLVELHFLSPPMHVGDNPESYLWHQTGSGLAEDFADSSSPLVVKIDPYYSKREVVRKLRQLADSFEYSDRLPDQPLPAVRPGETEAEAEAREQREMLGLDFEEPD
jgi:hypothetical protein